MRVVARNLPFNRAPWLLAGTLLVAGGLVLVARAQVTAGWAMLLLGGGLLLLTAHPAYTTRERIVFDEHGLTDLATRLGPVPWTDIVRAEVLLLGRTPLVAVEVANPEEWEARGPESLKRIRHRLAPEMNLPPVLLLAPRLTLTPDEIVHEINRRALAPRG